MLRIGHGRLVHLHKDEAKASRAEALFPCGRALVRPLSKTVLVCLQADGTPVDPALIPSAIAKGVSVRGCSDGRFHMGFDIIMHASSASFLLHFI